MCSVHLVNYCWVEIAPYPQEVNKQTSADGPKEREPFSHMSHSGRTSDVYHVAPHE